MSDRYERWKAVYRSGEKGQYPWELGKPRDFLVKLMEQGMITGSRALDICCGLGTNGLFLAESGFDVAGIDISDQAVAIANQRAQEQDAKGSAHFLVENFMRMRFQAESFDFVLDVGCFHHVAQEDRRAFIENVYRVLKQGGRYLLMCFSDRMGPAWNHFSGEQIQNLFHRFETLLLDEISSREGDGAIRHFYVALMEKSAQDRRHGKNPPGV